MDRREFLRLSAALGGMLLAKPALGFAAPRSSADPFGVPRRSRLFPDRFVVHSDLHNHSAFSGDAVGDPVSAFGSMLDGGLDAAALTDHAIMGKDHGHVTCSSGPCKLFVGLNDENWAQTATLADAATGANPGAFVALRGFEWSTGTLGHINVWFTQQWTDPMHTRSLVTHRALPEFFAFLPGVGPELAQRTRPVFDATPEILASMDGFYEWLASPPERPILSGGGDGIAGFNHPNLFGNFDGFRLSAVAKQRLVSCEAMTGTVDYLFYRSKPEQPEPLSALLNAGWNVGMIGVSDEHGVAYALEGKGRGGLWVKELSRAGIREAMEARRSFATREAGLRFEAAANGIPMGGILAPSADPVRFTIDVAKAGWTGKRLSAQLVLPGSGEPVVDEVASFTMVGDEALQSFDVRPGDVPWVMVRVTDNDLPGDDHLPEPVRAFGRAIAYSSPWFLAT